MALKSSPERFGAVAIAMHWTSAALIVALLILGMNADNAQTDEARRAFIGPHTGLGILVLVLTLARIVWWWLFDRRPGPFPDQPLALARAGRVSHVLIYLFILVLGVTGVATGMFGGVSDALVSGAPIPPLDDLEVRRWHGMLAWTFMTLLAIHVAAALFHHFIRRDKTLARMVGRG